MSQPQRDEVIDFIAHWSDQTGLPLYRIRGWAGISESKYYSWKKRYGQANEHNGKVPKRHWITEAERDAILEYAEDRDLTGYRRMAYQMLDEDVVAVSPSTVYRVLSEADQLSNWKSPSSKGEGFEQPTEAHEHWHMDVSYLNIAGTFFYFCGVLDGYSRTIVHYAIKAQMREADVELILQKAHEQYPDAAPRIITDNGPQFIARDFKSFVREAGMSHVRTSAGYPESNGKFERMNKTLKDECIRRKVPLSLEEGRELMDEFVTFYNTERLHSAIGHIAPIDKLEGREDQIMKERKRKLEEARQQRALANRRDRPAKKAA